MSELENLQDGMRRGIKTGTAASARLIRLSLLREIKSIGRDRFGKTRGKAAIAIRNKYAFSTVGRTAKSAGHWAMVDLGTKPHKIERAFGRSGSVPHPGMAATGVWDAGLNAVASQVDTVVARGIEDGMTKEFGRG
jgi:hypothetical protein